MARAYDVVVVGAGSAGAVLAARLSEDPGRRVLLLEAGADYRSAATPPALRGPDLARALASRAHRWPALTARATRWQPPRSYACGRGVGGSSAINGQIALRPPPADFAPWPSGPGAGWSWPAVLEAFVALEDDLDFGTAGHHGSGGPTPVSRVPADGWGAVGRGLADAATAAGHAWCEDANHPGATGAAPLPFNRRDGARVSTNDAYLEPARERANLHVEGGALAERVLCSGGRATGVAYARAGLAHAVEAGEVICCAGAVYSPALLLRSGIGPAADLRALGIDVVADLPAVGRNLADHPQVLLALPLAEGGRTRGPGLPGSVSLRWDCGGGEAFAVALDRARTPGAGGLLVALLDPHSTGRVRLASPRAAADPAVEVGLLDDARDRRRLAAAVRHAADLAAAPALARCAGGPLLLAPGRPVAAAGDAEVDRWLRTACTASFHAAGTCRMGEGPHDSVVDATGAVHGLAGLRVADASVLPRLPRAPTHLVTVMLAERLARPAR